MIARVLLRIPGALRAVKWLAGAAVLLTMLVALEASSAGGAEQPPVDTGDAITVTSQLVPLPSTLSPPTYAGHPAKWWHDRYLAQRRRTVSLKRTLLHTSTVTEALDLACAVYGNCATLWRRARCESHLDPGAVHNGKRYLLSADHPAGLLQFMPSTWRSTPFARLSIFSPYANALAAGWMMRAGRGGEWQCR